MGSAFFSCIAGIYCYGGHYKERGLWKVLRNSVPVRFVVWPHVAYAAALHHGAPTVFFAGGESRASCVLQMVDCLSDSFAFVGSLFPASGSVTAS